MTRGDWCMLWVAGAAGAGLWLLFSLFSPAARVNRRRRKNHSRLISKSNRPMVRFSVRLRGRKSKKP